MSKELLQLIQQQLHTGNKDAALYSLSRMVEVLADKVEILEKESSKGEREKLVKQYKNSTPKMKGGL